MCFNPRNCIVSNHFIIFPFLLKAKKPTEQAGMIVFWEAEAVWLALRRKM